jgi:hypothetical protein
MPAAAEVEEVYAALEEAARMLDAPCSRDNVVPLLTAFSEALADGLIVFSVQTGKRHAGELDYSFKVPAAIGDPYPYALSHGFVEKTEHPVGAVLSDVHARISVDEFGIDCGVAGGFKKFYAHFPDDMQTVAQLAEIPSMPRAVADNADLFARYGLEKVVMVGVDYKNKTINLYFQFEADGRPEASAIRSLLRETGLYEPTDQMLEFAQRAMRANITLSWDSSKIVRVTFAPPPARNTGPSVVPAPIEPHIERFVMNAPRTYDGERMGLYGVKWFSDGEYIDVCTYYRLSPWLVELMKTYKGTA